MTYHSKYSYTHVAGQIGRTVFFSIYKNRLKRGIQFVTEHNINDVNNIRLGDILITMFIVNNYIEKVFDPEKEKSIIKFNSEYIELITNNLIIYPSSLPMICEPKKWNKNEYGGFLSNTLEQQDIIKGSVIKHKHEVQNKESLRMAINYINTIKFRINVLMLEYL